MKTFDPTKPVQTRDGRPARILATDLETGGFNKPIAAAVLNGGPYQYKQLRNETVLTYTAAGHFDPGGGIEPEECPLDLVNVQQKFTKVVYFYRNGKGNVTCSMLPYRARERWAPHDEPIGSRIVTFEEGTFEEFE